LGAVQRVGPNDGPWNANAGNPEEEWREDAETKGQGAVKIEGIGGEEEGGKVHYFKKE